MAESKAYFPFQIKAHSVKDAEFAPISIKSLADHTERRGGNSRRSLRLCVHVNMPCLQDGRAGLGRRGEAATRALGGSRRRPLTTAPPDECEDTPKRCDHLKRTGCPFDVAPGRACRTMYSRDPDDIAGAFITQICNAGECHNPSPEEMADLKERLLRDNQAQPPLQRRATATYRLGQSCGFGAATPPGYAADHHLQNMGNLSTPLPNQPLPSAPDPRPLLVRYRRGAERMLPKHICPSRRRPRWCRRSPPGRRRAGR
jgi:hypothetical protein